MNATDPSLANILQTTKLLHKTTIAITAGVPLERLRHAIAPFPTRNEVWLYLLEEYGL